MTDKMAYTEMFFRTKDGTDYLIKGVLIKNGTSEDGVDLTYAIARVYHEDSEIFNPKTRPRFDSTDDAIDAAFGEIKEYHYGKK